MASKEELYLSIHKKNYKKNKANILNSQAHLLNTLKKIHTIQILARKKHDLKIHLHKQATIINKEIEQLQKKLPTTKIPKIRITKTAKEEQKKETKEKETKNNHLEKELQAIQEKLRELNQ